MTFFPRTQEQFKLSLCDECMAKKPSPTEARDGVVATREELRRKEQDDDGEDE